MTYEGWVARGRTAFAAIIVGSCAFMSSPAALAQPMMSEAEARQIIEDRYGVQVLRIDPTERDGTPVFVMRVMNPAGDFNEAFQVNVLMMDRQSGELIPQFRHEASGVAGSADGRRDIEEDIGPILRRGSTQ